MPDMVHRWKVQQMKRQAVLPKTMMIFWKTEIHQYWSGGWLLLYVSLYHLCICPWDIWCGTGHCQDLWRTIMWQWDWLSCFWLRLLWSSTRSSLSADLKDWFIKRRIWTHWLPLVLQLLMDTVFMRCLLWQMRRCAWIWMPWCHICMNSILSLQLWSWLLLRLERCWRHIPKVRRQMLLRVWWNWLRRRQYCSAMEKKKQFPLSRWKKETFS